MTKKPKIFKILFTGGGTAGHIYPIIAVVREWRCLDPQTKFYYIGPRDEFANILLSREEIKVKHILAGKIRRYISLKSIFQNMIDILFKIPLGFLQTFFIILFLNPHLTFSKGGYGSLAAVFWSWFFRTPVFLHESDAVPGLVNRFTSKMAFKIFLSFALAQTKYFPSVKMISVGNPIRKEIIDGSLQEAKELFYLKGGKRGIVLILGGSQGAQKINNFVLEILPRLLMDFEVIHQTGEKNFQQVKAESKVVITKESNDYYHPIPLLKEEELKQAYAAADLVISRAGAGAIFEIAACGKPSILIPLSTSAQDHQVKNAYIYAGSGAAIVVEENNLTSGFFLEKIKYLFSRPEELNRMRQAAQMFARPDAAQVIARDLTSFLEEVK